MAYCNKCLLDKPEEDLLLIETEKEKHAFCKPCLKEANDTLSMKIYLNKEERALLKKIRKYIKHEKN